MISGQLTKSVKMLRPFCVFCVTTLAALVPWNLACAQNTGGGFGFGFGVRQGVVGGVSIDAQGQLRSASQVEQSGMLRDLRQALAGPDAEAAKGSSLRMISLAKLQEEIGKAIAENRPLSEEILYLAGLQRVEYVFVYPEQHDIVLAGPAEGWVVREDAAVVGETSGRPVLQLEDLIVALRTVPATQQQTISVSIDPTPEGQLRLNRLLSQLRVGPGFDPKRIEQAMCNAFGPQMVTITAVPADSRMASTLVAADYRMKRLAMNLEDAQVAGLPSYLDMIKDSGTTAATQPRWWIACNYEAVLHSPDHLAWKLSGLGVKAMTEEEYVSANGSRRQTGKVDQRAQRWADLFTEKFDELCATNAAFGDLRNIMDLNIVATIIRAHDLEKAAGCDFGLLTGAQGQLQTPSWQAPKTIAPECSFVRGRAGWTVSASGGVEINPWRIVAERSQADTSLVADQSQASPASTRWWWD
jgi:hypothetical protein